MKIHKTANEESKEVRRPEVGDKYIITIAEVADTSKGYVARARGFNTLMFDETGISKLKRLPDADSRKRDVDIRANAEFNRFLDRFTSEIQECTSIYMSPANDVLRGSNYVKIDDLAEIVSKYRSEVETYSQNISISSSKETPDESC